MAIFYNYSNEDFSCSWNGVPYKFKAGEIKRDLLEDPSGNKILLEKGIAETFAIHLADREMLKAGHPVNLRQREISVYEEFIARALGEPEVAEEPVVEEPEEEIPVITPKKRGRKKKEVVSDEII